MSLISVSRAMSKNSDKAIESLYTKALGWGREVMMIGHVPVLLVTDTEEDYSCIEEPEYHVTQKVYSPEDWKWCYGPVFGEMQKDGTVTNVYDEVQKPRKARCLSEAKRFLKLWKENAGV